MERQNFSSGAPREPIAGYSRAVRVGHHVFVAGTTATGPDGKLLGAGDAHAQAEQALRNVQTALESTNARLEDTVRTRIFVKNIGDFEEIARAHRELFGDIRPVTSMIEVSRFVDPAMLVEIEADAVVTD